MCNHSSSDSDPQEEYSPLSVEEYLPEPVEDHSPSSDDFDPQEEYSPLSVEEYLPQPVEDHSPSSDDFDPQEEYSPLSVEEYLPQPVEDHSPSSNDFDPQEENSQLLVEEFLPPLVEDDSPLLDNFNPQEVYSPMSVEEYSPLLDEMPIEENTIEQYTPGTFEEDESQQSPRIEMDEEYIEGYRNYEKLLAEFVNKLEGHQMDFNTSFYEQLLSFGDLIVSEWPWSDGGIESIWKEITHALLKVLPEELRQHNYVTLTLMEADVITTFSEALEIILDYDDHRVRRNLRKHAVSSMGPDLKTQKRYDRKAGWNSCGVGEGKNLCFSVALEEAKPLFLYFNGGRADQRQADRKREEKDDGRGEKMEQIRDRRQLLATKGRRQEALFGDLVFRFSLVSCLIEEEGKNSKT
ncbi:hypothetical protein LWI29_010285 [Acer saccharum]|uniref:Uncharacterized protein n=1 Tax=Acer saccharum TaxID=4024 RepID=A0AA39S4R9_ACESA|nr:hypothetical protein LWI29_010285 [Acer saccharum]